MSLKSFTQQSPSDIASNLAQTAHNVVDQVQAGAQDAVETLQSKTKGLSGKQAQLMAGARDMVRERPLAAIGLALAAGLVISRLTR